LPLFAGLLHATWLELPSRPINQEVFQDELAFAALQWTTTVITLDPSVQPNMIGFSPNQLVLRVAVWAIE
jgi:hypothetical protein